MGLFIDANGTTKNSFGIKDTNSSHFLHLVPGSDLTADRNLTITIGDAARTITLSGNPTLDDWFDQSVKQTASPVFANVVIADGGTVGQSGGPLMKFDDTSNYLLITGCKVGVGLYTSLAPIAAFHVRDIYGSQGSLKFQMAVEDNTAYSGSPVAGITFRAKTDATPNINDLSGISGGKENVTSGDVAGFLSFHTRPAGGNNTERMKITSEGKVLIGAAAGIWYSKLFIHDTAGTDANLAIGYGSVYGTDCGGMAIQSINDAFDATKMLIFSASSFYFNTGNVGIGVIVPTAGIDIGGSTTTNALNLRSGDAAGGTAAGHQIVMSYNGGISYAHNIVTKHDSGVAAGNIIGFNLWYYGVNAATTIGTRQVLTLRGDGTAGLDCVSPVGLLDTASCGGIYISRANVNTMGVGSWINAAANFHINYNGYNDSTGQFRNFIVNDGKHGTLADFIGSTKAVTFYGGVTVNSLIATADGGIWRSVNNGGLYISGGSNPGVGGHIILTGGANSSFVYVRGAQHFYENEAGSVRYFAHNGSNFYMDTGTIICQAINLRGAGCSINSAWPASASGTPIITSGNWLYYLSSTERNKIKIERNWTSPLLGDFLRINPIRYEGKPQPTTDDKPDPKDKVNPQVIGFSAEEIHASGVPGLINYDDELLPFSLREHGFLVYHHLVLQDLEKRLSVLEKK